jgi:hypothetical protein
MAPASNDGAATTLAEPKAERAKESATCASQIETRGKVKHLPFALDGDTHAFIRNAQGGDAFPAAGIAENPSPACSGIHAGQSGRSPRGAEFRIVIEEESICLHRIQGKPFALWCQS